jgi:N-acetylglucosamine kinase-like BadF-type ATPase
MDLVVGVDAGGTSTRAVVAEVHGAVIGRGSAGPGNPLTVGFEAAAEAMGSAVRAALGSLPPSRVARGVLGIAGTSCLTPGNGLPAYEKVWNSLDLTAPMVVVGDVVTAFAAGAHAPSGVVLIAGTGAIAAHIDGERVVRTVDGNGWLLGDFGSGRWIGLAALRAAVRDWSSPFAAAVAGQVSVSSADDLVAWAQRLPFPEIDALAPLVCRLSQLADPQARAITSSAAAELVSTLDELSPTGPVVLAGSLLSNDTPVREKVRAILHTRAVETTTSTDPAAGAARLAARALTKSC